MGDCDTPEHRLTTALGLVGIGPTAIHRDDGTPVGALAVQGHLHCLTKLAMPWSAWPRWSVISRAPSRSSLRNRAFDPAAHVADRSRRWSAN